MATNATIFKWWYRADAYGDWERDGVLILPVTHKKAVIGLLDKDTGLLKSDLGARTLVQDEPPTNPTLGMTWFDSSTGVLKTYYPNGASGVWVDAVPGRPTEIGEAIVEQNHLIPMKVWVGTQADLDAYDQIYTRDSSMIYLVKETIE